MPATYRARLLEELTEHRHDLQEENLSMEAPSAEERLGSPELLAATAKQEYLKRTFAGRHPFLAFVIGPIVVTFVVWHLLHLLLLVCVPCKWLVTPFKPPTLLPPTNLEWVVTYANVYVMRFLPFAVLAPLYVRTGRRCCRPVWGMVACGIVAYMAFVNYLVHLGSRATATLCFARPSEPIRDGRRRFTIRVSTRPSSRHRVVKERAR